MTFTPPYRVLVTDGGTGRIIDQMRTTDDRREAEDLRGWNDGRCFPVVVLDSRDNVVPKEI